MMSTGLLAASVARPGYGIVPEPSSMRSRPATPAAADSAAGRLGSAEPAHDGACTQKVSARAPPAAAPSTSAVMAAQRRGGRITVRRYASAVRDRPRLSGRDQTGD